MRNQRIELHRPTARDACDIVFRAVADMRQFKPRSIRGRLQLEYHPGRFRDIGAFPCPYYAGRLGEFEHFDIGLATPAGPFGRCGPKSKLVAGFRFEVAGEQPLGNGIGTGNCVPDPLDRMRKSAFKVEIKFHVSVSVSEFAC